MSENPIPERCYGHCSACGEKHFIGQDLLEKAESEIVALRELCLQAEAKNRELVEALQRAVKALGDLSTEEIFWQVPSAYWTETDCPGDQMWDTIHAVGAALKANAEVAPK